MGKVILIVIDSLGIGEMRDVSTIRKEDKGCNTLRHVLECNEHLNIPNLEALGIINALNQRIKGYNISNKCIYCRCALKYPGADSFLGHNEIVGINFNPFNSHSFSHFSNKIYHDISHYGYKLDIIEKNKLTCFIVDNEIIIGDNLEGEEGQLYSVIGSKNVNHDKLKIVANIVRKIVDIPRVSVSNCSLDIKELIENIDIQDDRYIGLRATKCDLYNRGYKVSYLINPNNKIQKEQESCIDFILRKHMDIVLIGKVCDLLAYDDNIDFHSCNISIKDIENPNIEKYNEISTEKIEEITLKKIRDIKQGLIFINFQETDNAGHVRDAVLYGKNLEKIDRAIGNIIKVVEQDDLLIVTADHGNDPCIGHSKHTREYVPVLLYKKSTNDEQKKLQDNSVVNLGNKTTLSYINDVILKYFEATT